MSAALSLLCRVAAASDDVVIIPRWLWDKALVELFLEPDATAEEVEAAIQGLLSPDVRKSSSGEGVVAP